VGQFFKLVCKKVNQHKGISCNCFLGKGEKKIDEKQKSSCGSGSVVVFGFRMNGGFNSPETSLFP